MSERAWIGKKYMKKVGKEWGGVAEKGMTRRSRERNDEEEQRKEWRGGAEKVMTRRSWERNDEEEQNKGWLGGAE